MHSGEAQELLSEWLRFILLMEKGRNGTGSVTTTDMLDGQLWYWLSTMDTGFIQGTSMMTVAETMYLYGTIDDLFKDNLYKSTSFSIHLFLYYIIIPL